jgi:ATP-dependent Clp protease ATP-binding subunit ClpA
MERMFRPEFRNRLDGVMIFKALTKEQIKDIMEYELRDVRSRLYDKDIAVTMTDDAKDYLAEEGYDPEFGARPLRRVLQEHIEDPLSEGILSGKYQEHDTLEVDYQDEEIIINIIGREEAQTPAITDSVNTLETVM